MTKKLEETLNLPETDSVQETEYDFVDKESAITKQSDELMNALSLTDRIDNALESVSGLDEHDREMDEIFAKAMSTFEDCRDLGMNVPAPNAGRILEVANNLLNTALSARNSKMERKLKIIDLQIKKAKLDQNDDTKADAEPTGNSYDRNELLDYILQKSKTQKAEEAEKPSKKDKK